MCSARTPDSARSTRKKILFAIDYAPMRPLSNYREITDEEAQKIVDEFNRMFPELRNHIEIMRKLADASSQRDSHEDPQGRNG